MEQRMITFSYRKIITHQHQGAWEKLVLNEAFNEFKMQFQYFNKEARFQSYADFKAAIPQQAEKLPHLVSGAILGYLTQLNEIVPDVIDNQGRKILSFKKFNLEILHAHIDNRESFKFAINFFSEPFLWLDTVGNFLIISPAVKEKGNDTVYTLGMQAYLSIHHYKCNIRQ